LSKEKKKPAAKREKDRKGKKGGIDTKYGLVRRLIGEEMAGQGGRAGGREGGLAVGGAVRSARRKWLQSWRLHVPESGVALLFRGDLPRRQ